MIKCLMDTAIEPTSKCAKCCIYCKEKCQLRCVLSKECNTEEDVFEKDCIHAYEE